MEDSDATAGPWATPWSVVAGAAGLGLLLAVLAVATSDPPGRFLLAVGGGLAGLATAAGALLRPVLDADSGGLTLRRGLRAHRVDWRSVRRVAEHTERHRGLASSHLEIEVAGDDGGDATLIVYPRLLLGAEPSDVAARLTAIRANQPS